MDRRIDVTIKEIISDRGVDILKKPRVFCSILDDLLPEEINARTILRHTLISCPEVSSGFYSLLIVDAPLKEQISKLEFLMENNYGISIEWTQAMLYYFGFAAAPLSYVTTDNDKTDLGTVNDSEVKNTFSAPETFSYDNILCGVMITYLVLLKQMKLLAVVLAVKIIAM